MHDITPTEKEICDRFEWNLVKTNAPGGTGKQEMYLTHRLLHGAATMAIPVDLERGTLTQAVATAAYTFNKSSWIRHADISKYGPDPYLSVETRLKGDADYAEQQLKTLCSALGLR
ncbi:MAG: hypothetical protein HDQ87_05085 [Clostridia bacterium]|nr:hypothetical protein [Clostridia bacterium]